MGGRRIMSLKPLELQSEAFSREKWGEGREKALSIWILLIGIFCSFLYIQHVLLCHI